MRRAPVAALAVAALGGVLLLVAAPGVGLVALAGTGAALLLQPRPRRVMAAVLAVVGLVTAVVGVASGGWLLGAGGALLAGPGVVAAVRSDRWPAPRRGDRDRARPPASAQLERPDDPAQPGSPADTWAALDRGEDPTA
jgi:tryptophan-associated transmembrane protein